MDFLRRKTRDQKSALRVKGFSLGQRDYGSAIAAFGLKGASVSTTVFGAKQANHSKLNDNLRSSDDPATAELSKFVGQLLRK